MQPLNPRSAAAQYRPQWLPMEAYTEIVYECGLEYLKSAKLDPNSIAALERSAMYWDWYCSNWGVRDRQVAEAFANLPPNANKLKSYIGTHLINQPAYMPRAVFAEAGYTSTQQRYAKSYGV